MNMEVDLLNLLVKALSAKDLKSISFICKRLKKYEPNYSERICSDFTISKKKWICFRIYRPPSTENIKRFFEEMNEAISKALCKYENLILMDDFNIDIKSCNSDKDKLEHFCDLFNLTNPRRHRT